MHIAIKWKCLAALIWFLLLVQPSFASDRSKLIGTWKLVTYEVETKATGQKEPVMGKNPTGYAIFSPDGRAFFLLTGEGRKPAKNVQDRAELLNTLIAYTGIYHAEGDKWTIKIDAAWNPEWVGTDQTRSFKIDGERLQVITPWRIMPNWQDKGITRSIVTFEQVK